MKRYERTRVLVEGDREVLASFAQAAAAHLQVEVFKEPVEELVMLKVREGAAKSTFFLGEALMVSCIVQVEDTYGYGMLLGEDREAAYQLAVVDAAYAHDAEWCEHAGWNETLCEQQALLSEEEQEQRARIAKTRVDFSTMDVDL